MNYQDIWEEQDKMTSHLLKKNHTMWNIKKTTIIIYIGICTDISNGKVLFSVKCKQTC